MDNSILQQASTVWEDSRQSISSDLALFDLPPTDVSTYVESDYIKFYPVTSLKQENSPIIFNPIVDGPVYFNFNDSFVFLKCRVTRSDGSKLQTTDDAAPCSLAFHNFFSNVTIYANSTLIHDSGNNYNLIANMQRLLSTNPLEKEYSLSSEFYYPDITALEFEKNKKENPGYGRRQQLSNESQSFTMMGKLVCNLWMQNRLIPGNVGFRIEMKRNIPQQCVNSLVTSIAGLNGCPYRVQIDEAILYMAQKRVSPVVIDMHRKYLSSGSTMKYPTTDVELKTAVIGQGMTSYNLDIPLSSRLPSRIVVGFISNEAYVGAVNKSNQYFQDFDLCELSLSWVSDTVEQRTFDYEFITTKNPHGSESFLPAFLSLQDAAADPELGNGIKAMEYQARGVLNINKLSRNVLNLLINVSHTGLVLTCFKLLPVNGSALSVNRKGSVKLSAKFRSPLSEAVNILVYCQFQGLLELTKEKSIIVNR